MNVLAELQRRNVFRMAGLYLVGAWLVVQVGATLLPVFDAPGWVMKGLVGALAAGFVAALVVSWIYELTPEGVRREDDIGARRAPYDGPERRGLRKRSDDPSVPQVSPALALARARRLDFAIIALLLLALSYFAYDKFVLGPARDAATVGSSSRGAETSRADTRPVAAQSVAPVDPKSIAVLAFANMSAEAENEYFSDGVAEEILIALAKVEGLKVAGRTSSFYFKGRSEPLAAIGSALLVAHVLEGSVRKQGDRLRIGATLLRVRDGVQMWSDTFDGTDADIFALQENIAQRVAAELKVALKAGEQGRLVDVGTTDPDAYALYLRASEIFNLRRVERYDEAMAALQQALHIDPGFARAHSRLAALNVVASTNTSPERYDSVIAGVIDNAEQALRLNPDLAEPHAALGIMHQQARQWTEARNASARALERDADDATANFWAALLHCQSGYIAECERRLDRTLEIDPLLPNALNWRARLWVSAGDLSRAQRTIERAREVGLGWPAGITLSWISRQRGDVGAAREQALEAYTAMSTGLPPEAAASFVQAWMGDADAVAGSRRIIDAQLAVAPTRINATLPLTLVRIGDIERGLQVFAKHPTTSEFAFLSEILGTRLYPEVWASPAFPGFLRDIGIAAYWDAFGPPEHCRKSADGDYHCE